MQSRCPHVRITQAEVAGEGAATTSACAMPTSAGAVDPEQPIEPAPLLPQHLLADLDTAHLAQLVRRQLGEDLEP
ncbi:MAG: hypothetical protein ACTH0J_10300, partial [Corynebacterium variabile]|uniref:hypothetical protein n=1 Tax=Corynebacterium variabile TaxID=1727 RepID=UPI003F8EBA11